MKGMWPARLRPYAGGSGTGGPAVWGHSTLTQNHESECHKLQVYLYRCDAAPAREAGQLTLPQV